MNILDKQLDRLSGIFNVGFCGASILALPWALQTHSVRRCYSHRYTTLDKPIHALKEVHRVL